MYVFYVRHSRQGKKNTRYVHKLRSLRRTENNTRLNSARGLNENEEAPLLSNRVVFTVKRS